MSEEFSEISNQSIWALAKHIAAIADIATPLKMSGAVLDRTLPCEAPGYRHRCLAEF